MFSYDTFYFFLVSALAYYHSDINRRFDHNTKIGIVPRFIDKFDEVGDSYGFIIIGAGSAGSTVAHGISQFGNRDTNLLIEAGGEQSLESKIPHLMGEAASTGNAWQFRSSPQKRACLANNGECSMPRGRMMGGTSSINAMIYLRGNPKDFDDWESQGNPGWGWNDMLKHFRSQERNTIPDLAGDTKNHNRDGFLTVSENSWRTRLASDYLNAGKDLGFDITDLNGDRRTGFMYFQGTISEDGRRMSANRAFLGRADHLSITTNTLVTKILFKGNKAYGVIAEKDGVKKLIRAQKEILLCAGSIASPQLLMLSGVGPKDVLAPLGIPIVADLPVGHHLQDHLGVGLNFHLASDDLQINDMEAFSPEAINDYIFFGTGPLSSPAGIEALAFVNATEEERINDYPDIELIMSSSKKSWRIGGFQLRPKSIGRLTIRSTNLNDHPIINPNYLNHTNDLDKMVQIVKYAIALSQSPSLAKYGPFVDPDSIPKCKQPISTREFAECVVTQYSTSLHHQVGTCRMDKDGVVNPKLQIHGLEGIRVIDASIMPSIPSSNTNAIVIAIAGRAVEILKELYFHKPQ